SRSHFRYSGLNLIKSIFVPFSYNKPMLPSSRFVRLEYPYAPGLTNCEYFQSNVYFVLPFSYVPSSWIKPALTVPLILCVRSEEHTSELQSRFDIVCRLLLEK